MQTSLHGIPPQSILDFKTLVEKGSKFVICSHENPDADAYGSACGLGVALKEIGKQIVFLNSSELLQRLSFIPSATETLNLIPADFKPDAILVCDCGAFSRVGDNILTQLKIFSGVPLVNIDHHISNDLFGTQNIVVTEASSTSEIICALLDESKINISQLTATALYAGIVADSGSFRYSCVRPYTFEAASLCMSKGAVSHKVAEQLFSNNSLARVKLHANAMLEMTLHLSSKVALIVTSLDMIKKCGASVSDSDGLAEEGRDIEGVVVSILMKEDLVVDKSSDSLTAPRSESPKSIWRVSLRTKSAMIDLSTLAQKFGGGGHRAAAAFRSSKSQQEISSALLAELEKCFT